MRDLERYIKRIIDFPAIIRVPEEAKLTALRDSGARVLEEQQTEYQRILLLETPRKRLMLLLDGQLQFYSGDEHRYHEALGLVPVLHTPEPVTHVAVMGGGDGLVARELLKHLGGELARLEVVDIDPAMTRLARTQPALAELNAHSLSDELVHVVNVDARTFRSSRPLDLIICDLPDPTDPLLARLYHREFYAGLREQLEPGSGVLALQVPYAPPMFDGVLNTLGSVFSHVVEYAVSMYSFVKCGFALASDRPLQRRRDIPGGTRFLTPEVVDWLFYFPPDEPRAEVPEVATDANRAMEGWYARYLREWLEERILYF